MKFNFEMEPNEIESMMSGFSTLIKAYVDNERSAREAETKKEEKKAESKATELRKAREMLERAISV